ncbi:hypothetical protein [Streptomyces sp. S465]|uniref:hypothetical protein n=1 Tax=Streptomyces sp. S465 TaxID=2979468 RepID=UPI0022A848EB|nr:hypothetical protein [Streptomyces sp. S465]WAP55668.1 hypothetical protein N6H00_12095 [Streptomyces sp. S465]
MRTARTIASAVCTAAALGATLSFGTSSASAAPADTCVYPYVCIHRAVDGVIIGRFQDVTSEYQPLPSRPTHVYLVNTRHDDVVYVRSADGVVFCAAPGVSVGLGDLVLTGIRISSSATCD